MFLLTFSYNLSLLLLSPSGNYLHRLHFISLSGFVQNAWEISTGLALWHHNSSPWFCDKCTYDWHTKIYSFLSPTKISLCFLYPFFLTCSRAPEVEYMEYMVHLCSILLNQELPEVSRWKLLCCFCFHKQRLSQAVICWSVWVLQTAAQNVARLFP